MKKNQFSKLAKLSVKKKIVLGIAGLGMLGLLGSLGGEVTSTEVEKFKKSYEEIKYEGFQTLKKDYNILSEKEKELCSKELNRLAEEKYQYEEKRFAPVLADNVTYESLDYNQRAEFVQVSDSPQYFTTKFIDKYKGNIDRIEKTKEEALKKWSKEKAEKPEEADKVSSNVSTPPSSEISTPQINNHNITKVKFGELLDVKVNSENTLIIKTKIESSFNNKLTISQNGFNVEDIIKNQGGDKFDEIQYWAVADMTNGSEQKVVSFTLNKSEIAQVKSGTILGNEVVQKASESWILPSLRS